MDLEGAREETEKVLIKPASVPDLSRPPEPQTPLKLASQGCNEILQPLPDCKDNGEPSETQGYEGQPKAASLNSSVTSSKPARKNPERIEAGRGLPFTSCSPRRTRSMANKLLEGTVLRTPVPACPERLTTSDSEEAMQPDDDSDDEYVRVIRSSRSTDANLATNSEGRLVVESLPYCLDGEPSECIQWRAQAFADVWNCLEEHIQNAQRKQNKSTFDTIQHWIWTTHSSSQQTKLYAHTANTTGEGVVWPATGGIQSKQLNTGLLLLGGVDPADQEGTFDELAVQLKSANCHVAALTPSDFLCRGGVAGPLRSLLKQFVSIDPDTTDLEILASWYREPANQGRPLVVLIESAESSRAEILAHLIVALSELISRIPMFLVLGLATTAESLWKTLPANALERLKSCKFSLRSPVERLEAVVSEALVSTFCGFEIGHSVAAFMEAYFKTHDLTISFLLRSLKVACVEHFSREPLSFLCSKLLHARTKSALEEDCLDFPDVLLKYASSLQSLRRMLDSDINGRQLSSQEIATLLWELREHKSRWCMALQCLHQAGKHARHSFVTLFCKALKPSCSDFGDILSIVRNLPRSTLSGLLDEWKTETAHVKELAPEVVALKGKLEAGVTCEARDARPVPQAGMNKKQLRSLQLSLMKQMYPTAQNSDTKSVGILAAEFLQRIVEKFLIPVETLPLHEVVCFKKEVLIKQAVSGEIRRRVHSDLVQSQSCLQCKCCARGQSFSPTSPDACISFCLAEEHNDHINVHDWYQSFAAVFSSCNSTQHTPVKKKKRGRSRENGTSVEPGSKAIIQAKFSKAAAELQLLGLVRFPKKKRPDFIQRAAFGF